ncbi:MAG: hypothetical protein INR65_09425 [Gluconacetobacter diazotrophicus]|nr:hypothetical protein [Gluconacetobacter diazotrophicus]
MASEAGPVNVGEQGGRDGAICRQRITRIIGEAVPLTGPGTPRDGLPCRPPSELIRLPPEPMERGW